MPATAQFANTALYLLDTIAQQHSEWSGHAQRMAAQWRKGELKAWGEGKESCVG